MLIDLSFIKTKYSSFENIFSAGISNIIHVGAHLGEESASYSDNNINKVIWIEGNEDLIEQLNHNLKSRSNDVILNYLIGQENGKEVCFHISNNGQSSSILEFGTHSKNHPEVKYIEKKIRKTYRLDYIIESENINPKDFNFLNLDIQGCELDAIKSYEKYLINVDYIYTEVNSDYVYKNCSLIGEMDLYLSKFGFSRKETHWVGNFNWGDALYVKV